VRSLAHTMAELCGTKLVVRHRPARCGEVRISIGDPQRAVEQLGFTAQTTLSDGLEMTLDVLRRGLEVEAQVVA
jgi:UDP-glucose 4-epimerase